MTPLLPVLLDRRGRIILITMHVLSLVCLSREARCQEAQVFPTIEGGCSLSWLHKQASCFPASSTSSLTPGSPGLPSRVLTTGGKKIGGVWERMRAPSGQHWGVAQPLQNLQKLWVHLGQHRLYRHLFSIEAEHAHVCVVTIAQGSHSANKYGTLGFVVSSF